MGADEGSGAARFAELSNAMAGEPAADTCARAAAFAAESTRCDAAVVLVAQRRLQVAASTSAAVDAIERAQAEANDGPAPDIVCGAADPQVGQLVVSDLGREPAGYGMPNADDRGSGSMLQTAEMRWPAWVAACRQNGKASALCTRVVGRSAILGVITLYSSDADAFDSGNRQWMIALASHLGVALAASREEEGLRMSVSTRTLIGQAQGILMERYGLDEERAFAVLRRYSQDGNVKLLDVAADIVATRRLPESV